MDPNDDQSGRICLNRPKMAASCSKLLRRMQWQCFRSSSRRLPTLILNGAVKASIDTAKTKSGQPTQLNFDLKSSSALQASGSVKKTKHKVWVTAGTGTHLGGRWVEEDDNSTAPTSTDKVDKVDPFALKKLQGTHGTVTPP